MPMMITAVQTLEAMPAKATGITATAQISMVSLRAAFRLMPRFRNWLDSQPPPIEPTSLIR